MSEAGSPLRKPLFGGGHFLGAGYVDDYGGSGHDAGP